MTIFKSIPNELGKKYGAKKLINPFLMSLRILKIQDGDKMNENFISFANTLPSLLKSNAAAKSLSKSLQNRKIEF
jgi:hypothetical protein